MAPNWSMGSSYSDERRHSVSRSDQWRPGDRERPPAPSRRDSRDFRDSRHPSEESRSPGERRCNYGPLRPSRIDTDMRATESPRKVSNISPASVPSDDLRFKRTNAASEKTIAASSTIRNPATTTIPKAKDPKLQEVFEKAYKCGDKFQERLLLNTHKKKLAQEGAQRRLESEKFRAKAGAYPPYHGLGDRFNPIDKKLDDKFSIIDEEYAHELEQLVAPFTTVANPTAANPQDPVIATLEAKIEQVSQMVQSLAQENRNSRSSINSLETRLNAVQSDRDDILAKYSTLEVDHNALKADHDALKSDHDALKSKSDSFDDTIRVVQSQQTSTDAKNKNMEKKFELSDASWRTFKKDTQERGTSIEAKLHDYDDYKEKLDELDLGTLNEICDAWVDSVYNLKTQHQEYRESCLRRNNLLEPDTAQSLLQDMTSTLPSQANIPRSDKGTALSNQVAENIIDAKVAALQESVHDLFQKTHDSFGELMDESTKRLLALEEALKQPNLEARVHLLEQWKATISAWIDRNPIPSLTERVGYLESSGLGLRVDRIDFAVSKMVQDHKTLTAEVEKQAKREWVENRLQELLNNIGPQPASHKDVKDLMRRIPAIELAIQTLDTQVQNISTKRLAEHIVRLTTPGIEQRLGKLETKTTQLESKTNGHDRSLEQHSEQLKLVNDTVRSKVSGDKRTASPIRFDETGKKRKMELNGRHNSPLHNPARPS
ncbi:hypothetical protein F4802DRAFT_61107 [Xylaria palmicola]|nr:hypothetical protein F4802DRAFT_61107 [Xylaria palmicola]